jgi:prevent-host-death family protein
MRTVNISSAKSQLGRLIRAAESGETVILARAGKPVVQLIPYQPPARRIRLGLLKGQIAGGLIEDIDKPLTRTQIDRMFGSTL